MAALTHQFDTPFITNKVNELLLVNNTGQKLVGEAVPMHTFTEVKKEEVDPEELEVKREEERPLDYSEVQVVSCGGPL